MRDHIQVVTLPRTASSDFLIYMRVYYAIGGLVLVLMLAFEGMEIVTFACGMSWPKTHPFECGSIIMTQLKGLHAEKVKTLVSFLML